MLSEISIFDKVMEGNAKTVIGLVDGGVKEFACFLSKINCARNHVKLSTESPNHLNFF